jgi:2-keto-4-pentenoate hydratase/2-oxohepta-3-ene-1,7-dioic acid hydratase in catechol pathway
VRTDDRSGNAGGRAAVRRFVRYRDGGRVYWGLVEGEGGLARELAGDPFGAWRPNGYEVQLDAVELLPPCVPTKIVAVGLNYRDHAREMGKALPAEPLLFLKPTSALIGHGGRVELPPESERVDHEGELAVVIGRRCRRAADEREADAAIAGYTCFLDVTARDLQQRDVQYTRAKGFDTFAPCGPWLAAGADVADVAIETVVNGLRRQASRTAEMIFRPAALVRFVSQVMTLEPGDLIATGTPAGVGPLRPGDVVEVRIERVGVLRVGVTGSR